MPRAYLYDVVLNANGLPVPGASVQVNTHGGGAASLFTTEAGGVTQANPMTTESDGSFSCWLAEGTYDLVISGAGLTTITVYRDVVRGSNTPGALLSQAGDIVYASAANTLARLAAGTSSQYLKGGDTPSWSSIDPSAISGFPSDASKALLGDGTWGIAGATIYRKTTSKTVSNSVAETDLLNGEITVAAGVMSTTRLLRLSATGDALYNTGGTINTPRFKLKLGGTTLFDSSLISSVVSTSATRQPWRIQAEIANLGVANSQSVWIRGSLQWPGTGSAAGANPAVGEGVYLYRAIGSINEFEGWNSGTIDTSLAQSLVLSVTLATASASHEFVLKNALVEVI